MTKRKKKDGWIKNETETDEREESERSVTKKSRGGDIMRGKGEKHRLK